MVSVLCICGAAPGASSRMRNTAPPPLGSIGKACCVGSAASSTGGRVLSQRLATATLACILPGWASIRLSAPTIERPLASCAVTMRRILKLMLMRFRGFAGGVDQHFGEHRRLAAAIVPAVIGRALHDD